MLRRSALPSSGKVTIAFNVTARHYSYLTIYTVLPIINAYFFPHRLFKAVLAIVMNKGLVVFNVNVESLVVVLAAQKLVVDILLEEWPLVVET